jgi:serine/threonine protein kinase
MHRDLKPENIILKSSDNMHDIKIVDFGLASFTNIKEYIYPRCGTPGYVAPEIIRYNGSTPYGSKVDIFSAGVIFYVL